jgi:hypothetical protein
MRTLVEGQAYNNQTEIPVPGGFNSGMLDVVVGGADLGMADYDDSNGMSVKLKVPMSSGTQFKIVAWTPNQTVVHAGGQLAGFRNRIINGDCRIVQRVSAAVTTAVGGIYGGPDRWLTANTAGGQYTQAAGTIAFGGINRPAIVQTVNTAATTANLTNTYWYGICQRIEGYNAFDMLGQTVTLSFIFLSNVSGTFSACVRDGAFALTCVQTFTAVANVAQKVSLVFNIPSNASIPANNTMGFDISIGTLSFGGTWSTSTLNTWMSGVANGYSGSTNWAATVGNFIAITDVQFELGAIATDFERRSLDTEYNLCKRYFQRVKIDIESYQAASQNAIWTINYPVTMRAAPTQTLWQGMSPSYGGAIATPPTFNMTAYSIGCTAPMTATGGTWFAVGYDVALSAEL